MPLDPRILKIFQLGVLPTAGAAGNAYAWDKFNHPDTNLFSDALSGKLDATRGMQAGFNALLGGLGGFAAGKGKLAEGGTLVALSPVKDLAIGALPLVDRTKETMEKMPDVLDTANATSTKMNWLLGGLGLGGLTLGGLALAKYLKQRDSKEEKGKVQYKLHGKNGDPTTEATVELPIDSPGLSPRMLEGLNTGIRRQLGKTVRYNSFKRDPETGKMIPYEEWHKKYVENQPADGEKSAAEKILSLVDKKPEAVIEVNEDGSLSMRSSKKMSFQDNLDMVRAATAITETGGNVKAAETRAWAEGAGSMMTAGVGGAAGAATGMALAGKIGTTPGVAGLLGGILGAAGPTLIAKALAALTPVRDASEQAQHDNQTAFSEYAMPGYAVYQSVKRTEAGNNSVAASFANTGSLGEGFTDADFDKDAGMTMQPAAPGASVAAPTPTAIFQQPAPMPGNVQSRVPVKPNPEASQPTPGHADMGEIAHSAERIGMETLAKQQSKMAFTVDELHVAPVGEKSAASLDEVRSIMDRVYKEDPSYWPYGLSPEGHDDLYVVRDNITKAAAGFVGWQEQDENGRRVGSYSIGILPEYRGNGYAKEAVAKIIQKRASGVDEVRAYVMPHNRRSKGLAASLNVPVKEKF